MSKASVLLSLALLASALAVPARAEIWVCRDRNGVTRDVRLAVAACYAGEGAVLKAGRQVPNYPETIDYVRKVTNLHDSLKPPRAVSQSRSDTLSQTLPPRPPGRV